MKVIWAQAQAAQGGGKISILGDIRNISRHGPVQSAEGSSSWPEELAQMTSSGSFQLQPVHDSVIVLIVDFLCLCETRDQITKVLIYCFSTKKTSKSFQVTSLKDLMNDSLSVLDTG